MSDKLKTILAHKAINGWNLFYLVAIPISLAMLVAMMRGDLSSGESVSSMIQLSVRISVPFLYLAFAASSLQQLFPGWTGRWLLRNRKIFGLCFAAAMAWQLFFILWMVGVYTDYYVGEVYVLSDVIEGVAGYMFLFVMVLTSFKFGRKYLSGKAWKYLHKSGIYFLWGYAWSVYWYELFYYDAPDGIDYIFYWAGFIACVLRIAAWSKKRRVASSSGLAFVAGLVVIAGGLLMAVYGSPWSAPAFELFYATSLLETIGTYVPYYPFVPFFPIFVILLGSSLLVKTSK